MMSFHSIVYARAFVVCLMTAFGIVSAFSQARTDSELAAIGIPTHSATKLISLPTVSDVPVDSAKTQGSLGRGNPLWAIPLSSLSATRERPLFSPSRRAPATAQSSAKSASPPTRPPLALVGAIAGETDGIAIFLDQTTKGTIRLKTGESHLGWTLRLVKGREAILQKELKTAIFTIPNPS
jgi:general secretion pathway protein N